MIKHKLNLLLIILIFPLLINCAGQIDHNFSPTGYKMLDKNELLKNDGYNKLFIMEEAMTQWNAWSTGNDYFIDGEFVGKLSYGLILPYKTKKNKIKVELFNSFFVGFTGESGRNNPKKIGGRALNIDFSKDNEQYFIAYTDETNFTTLGGALSMMAAQKRLEKTGEPFKFRSVSKDTWWKIHDDLTARGSNKKYSPLNYYSDIDLQTARDLQGVSP